jgi:tetratricopeptide (TPR) repeat protein/SAM-dependent methyltransferase
VKPGRNHPCPCGSGTKFKHCHGAAGASPASGGTFDGKAEVARAAAEFRAGRLDVAAARLDRVLSIDPRDSDALLLSAGVAFRQQDHGLAIERLTRLLEARPSFAQAHFNLALYLAAQDRRAEAEARYREAIRLQPTFLEASTNLGNLLRSMGRLEEAEALHRSVVEETPRAAHAWLNLASSLKELGRLADAEGACREALRLDPHFTDAHNNLGNVLLGRGQHDAAIAAFEAALRLRPADADVECNRALALKLAGRVAEAVPVALAAFRRGANKRATRMLADCLRVARFEATTSELEATLATLLDLPAIDPDDLVPAVVSALHANATLAPLLERAAGAGFPETLAAASAAQGLDNPLLLRLMTLTTIFDAGFEQLFTRTREALLFDPTLRRRVPLAFLAALAHQCFLAEYVYAESAAEATAVAALSRDIAQALRNGSGLAPDSVAMLACYRALGREPFAAVLRDCTDLAVCASVIARQVIEPAEEVAIAAALPSLSPIEDTVSMQVRAQYEANPYPRWCKAGLPDPLPFARAVRELFPDTRIDAAVDTTSPRILVAGCGTGKHAILTACRYANARVTAVDLSRGSLAYGARQARGLGVRNIEFLQADILDLGRLEADFDLVESFGVLHHLRDPMAGWRVLAALVKRGGLMMIGLYSEIARKPVVEARRIIAERGYPATLEGVRRFRADLRASGDTVLRGALEQSVDFYSASGCRDLLFHVQEHRYTMPQIETSVRALDLEFIGLELHDATVLARYRARFPDDPGATSFTNWDKFEREHPDTFAESYKFWLRKPLRVSDPTHGTRIAVP